MTSSVFVFNPFAEGYLAHGEAFTPVKYQAMLAHDLANLPQFLCSPHDIVLLNKTPAKSFLDQLEQAGFPSPEFVELKHDGLEDLDNLTHRKFSRLRPWAWGPDAVKLLKPLFPLVTDGTRTPEQYFNRDIARLYSKAWSADFLRNALAHCREAQACAKDTAFESWLCSEPDVGVEVDTMDAALRVITAIRSRGHHRVIVKQALGLAGHNALRLWEPELLPTQLKWMTNALEHRQQLVIGPWLERELDFSAQLEMESGGLRLCGYTGLANDRKGQFIANWAEPDYSRSLPERLTKLFRPQADVSSQLPLLYRQIFSLLEAELRRVNFLGPVGIDAFIYRTPHGDCRLKPIVEINPRYTMGRVLIELMKHVCLGNCGVFRLVNRSQARAEGCADFAAYARSLRERFPLHVEGKPIRIRHGAICLNDPDQAQACLAILNVSPTLTPDELLGNAPEHLL